MPLNKKLIFWDKKDGTRVLISKMSDHYLLQTIMDIEKKAKTIKGKSPSTVDKRYNILRMTAIMRNLKINKKGD